MNITEYLGKHAIKEASKQPEKVYSAGRCPDKLLNSVNDRVRMNQIRVECHTKEMLLLIGLQRARHDLQQNSQGKHSLSKVTRSEQIRNLCKPEVPLIEAFEVIIRDIAKIAGFILVVRKRLLADNNLTPLVDR